MSRTSAFLTGALGSFATLEDGPAPRAASAATKARMAAIGAKHGLSATQQAEPARLSVVGKLVAGGLVSVQEFEVLFAGAAGKADVARAFPGVAARFYR